jgi:hypothetical protein
MPEGLSPRRTPYAGGEFITRFPSGEICRMRIDSPHEKSGWRARIPGDLVTATFPGTPIYFAGDFYELVRAEMLGARFVYYLAAWDPAFPLRAVATYSAAEIERLALERERDSRHDRAGTLLFILTPLIGCLPRNWQEKIESAYGIAPSRSTFWSATLILQPAGVCFLLGLAASLGMGGADRYAAFGKWLPVAAYFVCESLVRIAFALSAGEGIGTLPVALAMGGWDAFVSTTGGHRGPRSLPAHLGGQGRWSALVETIAPLWGLLDRSGQEEIAELHPGLGLHLTMASIAWTALFSIVAMLTAASYLIHGRLRVADLAVFVGGLALGIDAGRRAAAWARGDIEASLLAPLVRPLAKWMLRKEAGESRSAS